MAAVEPSLKKTYGLNQQFVSTELKENSAVFS
jgi:hypothetical protein